MEIPGIREACTIADVPLFAGTSMATAAWIANSLADLKRPQDKRGEDELIPGVDEHIRNPRRPTLSRRLVPMAFFGTHDPDGDAFDDHNEGCETNLLAFQEDVVETTGEVEIELVLLSGVTRTGFVVVEDFVYGTIADGHVSAVLDVSITRKLEEAGS